MKKIKSLKTGDYLYFYRDSDYSLEDVEKCKVEVFSNETVTFLSFGWGFVNYNMELVANATKVTVNIGNESYHFYVSPPSKSHYKKNIKRRRKELELEITKLKFAKLALGMTK